MNEAVIAALITGVLSLVGVVITCYFSSQKTRTEVQAKIETAIAVQNAKIEELTREVRQHNNFAQRMPVVENEIKHIKDDIHKYHD
jgi:CHASE3 domain sensor protein